MNRPHAWIAALALSLAASPALADVTWRHGALDPVLAEARTQSRLVLLDFGADWCVPCQELNHTVWNRADVTAAVTQGYVPLQVDADAPEGSALMSRFHVGGLPTIIAVRADGTEVGRLSAHTEPGLILALVGAWRRGQSTLAGMADYLTHNAGDTAVRLDVGTRYAEHGDEANARLHLERVVADDPQNARGFAARALLALGNGLYVQSTHPNPAHAVEHLQTLVTRFGTAPSARDARLPLALSLHRVHRDPDARAAVDAYITQSPADAQVANARAAASAMLREHWDLPHAEQIARAALARAANDHALTAVLAEIVFAQGRAPEAAELAATASRLEPGNARYRELVTRFRAAPASTPTPANPAGRAQHAPATMAP